MYNRADENIDLILAIKRLQDYHKYKSHLPFLKRIHIAIMLMNSDLRWTIVFILIGIFALTFY